MAQLDAQIKAAQILILARMDREASKTAQWGSRVESYRIVSYDAADDTVRLQKTPKKTRVFGRVR